MKKNSISNKPWHFLDGEKVTTILESDLEEGISSREVKKRIRFFGRNSLTAKKGKSALLRFFLQFHQPLIYILIISGIVTAILNEWVESSVIFGVVIVNAIVGFLQEAKALKTLEILTRTLDVKSRVIRQGNTIEIFAENLVPGDLVLLRSGDRVPADLRLLRSHDLRIDESALTGESIPVDKKVESVEESTILAERKNMAYASTLVVHGQAKGIVVATGNQTEIGQISTLISETESLETPLSKKIKHFSNVLLISILIFSAFVFALGLWQGRPFPEIFLIAVAFAVALIPEGLPAVFTIILAVGISKMAKENSIIRKLPAVETLGSTTIICSDKTGTLTENKVTVQSIFAGNKNYTIESTGYEPIGDIFDDNNNVASIGHALKECLLAGLLCNESLLINEDDTWYIEGDPTEGALIVSARKAGLTEEHYSEKFFRIGLGIPFESEHQYMATIHDIGQGERKKIYIKGSEEVILPRCSFMLLENGQTGKLDKQTIVDKVMKMAQEGMRVLAFATIELALKTDEIDHGDVEKNLIFIGLQGMMDPPRPEVFKAIEACHLASIEVKMITGDHAITAAAIAKKLNLQKPDSNGNVFLKVITGKELSEIPDDQMEDIVANYSVFARVTPQQKLHIIQALQSRGNIVAMTGDGVNDAPAMKQADIGIAIGKGGTEIATEVADMVLLDNNFATFAKAVEQGRCVFDNLKKFIVWTLATNGGAGLIILISLFIEGSLVLLPEQILWINLTTSLMLGLPLAFETKEKGIMTHPPRDTQAPIISRTYLFRILLVSILMTIAAFFLFNWELSMHQNISVAQTVVTNVVIVIQIFYLLNCRSLEKSIFSINLFSNKLVIFGISGILIFQMLYTYVPIFNHLFQSAPISSRSWVYILLCAVVTCVIIEFEKCLSTRYFKNQ